MSFQVKSAEIDASSGKEVIINNNDLLNALVTNSQDALLLLRDEVGPVYTADLSVDNQGRVVIRSEDFTKLMQQKLAIIAGGIAPAGDTNVFCRIKVVVF